LSVAFIHFVRPCTLVYVYVFYETLRLHEHIYTLLHKTVH
jgi:hypothetical protein